METPQATKKELQVVLVIYRISVQTVFLNSCHQQISCLSIFKLIHTACLLPPYPFDSILLSPPLGRNMKYDMCA